MINEHKNIPELRFSGFEGEWEEKLIKDILEFENNRRKPVTSTIREIGNYPYYGASGIIDYVKDYIFNNERRLLIGEDGAKWGSFEESSFIATGRYWVNNHAHVAKSELNNLVFLNNLLNYKELRTYVTGNAPAKLTYNNLCNIPILLPSIEEQNKIGNFFIKLDRQIELEEQKLEKLEEQKKGYMQKIFSQELRFKDGNGNNYSEWIKTNLKFLVSYKNGKGYEKEVVQNGKYNIINLNSISTKGMLKDSGKYTDFEDITLKKNDLIMILSDVAKGNLIGKTAIIDQDDKYLLNQRVASLRIKDESTSNVLFIYYFINYFRQYFINMSTGMSQLNINKSTVEDFLIYLPYIEEQDKIGNFFSNLDKSIIKQLDKIELLKERKKGFLQKMFV